MPAPGLAAAAVAIALAVLVPAAQAQAPLVLDSGHIDIAPRFVGDELRIQYHTNSGWHDIDDALLYVGPAGRIRIPADGRPDPWRAILTSDGPGFPSPAAEVCAWPPSAWR